MKDSGEYRVLAAGPTTSIREEPFQGEIIKRFGIRAVIGKGGIGAKTQKACQDYGQRVQLSVFECTVGPTDWVRLRERLLAEMDPAADSVRFYFLEADVRVEHHGAGEPRDMDGPLVV